MTGELDAYPERDGWDRVQDLVLVALSAVPGFGGPLEAFLDRVVGPSHIRRREAFIRTLADAVRELQARGVDVEDLPDDEAWITAVVRASRVAAGTHLDKKLEMLRAAIVNAALPDAPADFLSMRFLGFVEDLSPEHFLVLEYGRDPLGWYRQRGLALNPVNESKLVVLKEAGLGIPDSWLTMVVEDLESRSLLGRHLRQITTNLGPYEPLTSSLGCELVDFVTLFRAGGT